MLADGGTRCGKEGACRGFDAFTDMNLVPVRIWNYANSFVR